MNIKKILDELRFADEDAQVLCVLSNAGVRSRVYAVAQVAEDIPGVVLGAREPYLREKTVGTLREELKTFGARFQENDFLMEYTHRINEGKDEIRYYKLTRIEIEEGEVLFYSEVGQLQTLRKVQQAPPCGS